MGADRDSVNNLAADPAHRATLERMRAALKRHTLEINDNGFLPEGSALEGYDASRMPGAFPLERVFDLAVLASERDAANLTKLVDALDDPNEAVRWWAAQGCAMLCEKASPAEAALRKRLKDASGAVQVAAAEALARIGRIDTALPVLEHWVKNTEAPLFALQAANALDHLGERAQPVLPTLKRLLETVTKAKDRNAEQRYPKRILERVVAVLEGKEPALVYPKPMP